MRALAPVSALNYVAAVFSTTRSVWLGWSFVVWGLWGGSLTTLGEGKRILLRNEVIATTRVAKPQAGLQGAEAGEVRSGLYLVQFTGPLQTVWRAALADLGAIFLRAVPEDAAVVRLQETSLARLRALPFVHWVGAYRPEHKVHPSLRTEGRVGVSDVRPIKLLLSPAATALERLQARRALVRLSRETRSRFGVVLEGEATRAQRNQLASSAAVLWMEPGSRMRLFDEVASKIVAGGEVNTGGPGGGGDGDDPFDDFGLLSARKPVARAEMVTTNVHETIMTQLGFDGRGVSVSVADSGLHNGDAESMHPDLRGRVDAFFFYGRLEDAADEHSHGTHCAGIVAGNAATGEMDDYGAFYGLGVAPGVHLVAQRLFDGLGGYEAPPSFETLTRDAVRAGANIGSNSWGDDTQGRYDLSAAEFDALVRDADAQTPGDQPYILEFSAGNSGPGAQTIGSPAVAKNVIATGASQNNRFEFIIYGDGQEAMADFSSRGPCDDGRIKPDVVAPGTWIASLQSESATDENAWAPISPNYMYQGGTSQAGPHVSGAAAIFVQYYRETFSRMTPSPALVKAALINSAVDMDDGFGTAEVPNMDEGWGRVDLTEVIGSTRRFDYTDQTQLLRTGQSFEKRVVVVDGEEPFKVTLAYTDVPGLPAAIPALVNDLDLEVIAPDGTVYHGNQFEAGESVAGAPGFDSVNNVEGVHLYTATPGEYLVRVRARAVAEDARRDTVEIDQDFALVVSGGIPEPGTAVVLFDRPAYAANAVAEIKVIDFKQAGAAAVAVAVSSASESNGESLTLTALGSSGVFTGRVSIVTGSAVPDGRLQVVHDDELTASYREGDQVRTSTARADLVPPRIIQVASTNRFGRTVIQWLTDEPARSRVTYGTNLPLSEVSTQLAFRKEQEVALGAVVPEVEYRYQVESTDVAGNTRVEDRGGLFYTFVPVPAQTILLVNAYTEDDPLFGTTFIPLNAYTDAIERTGISYELWEVAERGSPGTNDLSPFRVVMWRLNDSIASLDTLSPQEQNSLRTYMNGGGSVLIASMELLTRLGVDSAFRTNVLQVASFVTDGGIPVAEGLENDPVSSGMLLELDYESWDNDLLQFLGQSPDLSDPITITTNGAAIFLDGAGSVAGVRYPKTGQDTAGRLVYLPFPLEAIPEAAEAPNNRANVLLNILKFLAPGINGFGTIALNSPAYTIPSLATVEVADSDLARAAQPSVTFFSETATNGVAVRLEETTRRGLYRGFITLVNLTNAPAAGQLRVAHGELVRVEYLDESVNTLLTATAVVDTVPPDITDVEVEPEYESATVTWSTSKDADSLVQFGESAFLNRTAYDGELGDLHEVVVRGLVPDRIYFYQVVSRDAAGNTTVDDNDGKLYTFRTLKPLTAPYFESFDQGPAGWTTVAGGFADDEDGGFFSSDTEWRIGVPNNGYESEAISPPNAWGSNLDGQAIEFADTDLISPAIELAGGNKASLRFWHSYDFTERTELLDLEAGGVLISTNNGAAWSMLRQYGDLTFGWEEEEIDLTPYLGRVVRLRWNYGLFAFEGVPRPGWLVDDIAVAVTNIVRGTLQITNNIAQATFVLSGALSQSGQGLIYTIPSAPVGEYVITYGAVADYLTPPPQTNILGTNATLVFQGMYQFPDANNNGMSDVWEQRYFGGVSPDRTDQVDTDADGVTDYAEFVSGTDPTKRISTLALEDVLPLPNGTLRLEWISSPGRLYRVLGSTNATTWLPFSAWTRADGTNSATTLPPVSAATPYFFQLEVRP